jgi:four helix bundle protein
MPPTYKFQNLKVYQLSLSYIQSVYRLASKLPESEKYNLKDQLRRAATSIVLNIAEGSTGQSDVEQRRFLGLALRSYLETVACWDLIAKLDYLSEGELQPIRTQGHELFIKLQALRNSLSPRSLREEPEPYD